MLLILACLPILPRICHILYLTVLTILLEIWSVCSLMMHASLVHAGHIRRTFFTVEIFSCRVRFEHWLSLALLVRCNCRGRHILFVSYWFMHCFSENVVVFAPKTGLSAHFFKLMSVLSWCDPPLRLFNIKLKLFSTFKGRLNCANKTRQSTFSRLIHLRGGTAFSTAWIVIMLALSKTIYFHLLVCVKIPQLYQLFVTFMQFHLLHSFFRKADCFSFAGRSWICLLSTWVCAIFHRFCLIGRLARARLSPTRAYFYAASSSLRWCTLATFAPFMNRSLSIRRHQTTHSSLLVFNGSRWASFLIQTSGQSI